MRTSLVLLLVVSLLGSPLLADESSSASVATNPALDRELDGLTNQEEMRRGTNPNASDSDSDTISDPEDAVGNDPVMRVPAALETSYAIIDLGAEYQPAGVNDLAEVLLLKPGEAPETELGARWKNGTLVPIAEGRKDSFRGPFLNGDVCFGTPNATSAVPGGNQTISENQRWASATQTISAAGRYFEHHVLTTPVGIPYPGTAPQMSIMTPNVKGTAERLLSAMKANIDPQLINYFVVSNGTHHQDYGAEMLWTNDLGENTFSSWTNTGQEITKSVNGIVLPSISLHMRMVLGGYLGQYASQSSAFGSIAWQGAAIPSQPPGDLRINMSRFRVATMDGAPTVISPFDGSRQPLPGAESLADLNSKTTPEGPYILGSSGGGEATIWCYNTGDFSSRGLTGYLSQPAVTSRLTNRNISNRLVIPLGDQVWRNGAPRTLEELCGASAENYQSWNIFQVSPNAHHLLAEAIPAEGGPPHALLLVPVDIAVDANRDGEVKLGSFTDKTTQDKPFRFWINDDQDADAGDVVPPTQIDSDLSAGLGGLTVIESKRDLEDFARIWMRFGGLQDAIAAKKIQVGLKWRNTEGTHPAINVFLATASDGSDSYLKSDTAAEAQLVGSAALCMGRISSTNPIILPTVSGGPPNGIYPFWNGLSEASPYKYLLFEGVTEGKGEVVMTFHDKDGNEIGEGPGVWLDLKDVKEMYARTTATPDTPVKPFESDSPTFDDADFNFSAEAYTPPSDEEKKALVFVHGWNMSESDSVNFSETFFKRMWHQGFKGRFCAFRWATLTGLDSYNTSEYRAWKYGRSLMNYVASLPGNYVKSVAAHSMGNVVAGSALQRGMSINRYFLMEAAIPGGCYNDAVNNYSLFTTAEQTSPTPNSASDLGYQMYLQGAYSNVIEIINFYNQFDFALATGSYPVVGNTNWEQNQISYKPDANYALHGNRIYAYDSGPPNNPYPVGQRCFLRNYIPPYDIRSAMDIHESMAFVARPRSKAIGADPNSASVFATSINLGSYGYGNAKEDHSGQFARRIQKVGDFYKTIFDELK